MKLKFLRQHPILHDHNSRVPRFFIADFYCAERNLVIELDGPIHKGREDFDQWRDEVLALKNIKTLRIENHELENIDKVLQKIKLACFPSLETREGPGVG